MTFSTEWFDTEFASAPIMAILRGTGIARSVELAEVAWNLGIEAVEVTVQSPSDLEALAAVVNAGTARGKQVGAGTIIDAAGAAQAAEAGAAFTVSPGLDLDIVRESERLGMPSIPGVATPSEVQLAQRAGLTWLKAFPASVLGTQWFTTMHGPFPDVRFVATGGMNARNAPDFLDAGVRVVAVGSALADQSELARLAEVMNR